MTVGDLYNLGSIYSQIDVLIPDIPSRLSGTNSYHTIMSAINYLEAYTGQSIGSISINAKYQDAIIYKSCIAISTSKALEGADAEDVKLGEFTIKKGGKTSNVGTATETFTKLLKDELRVLGRSVGYYRTY